MSLSLTGLKPYLAMLKVVISAFLDTTTEQGSTEQNQIKHVHQTILRIHCMYIIRPSFGSYKAALLQC